jgi:hypothetical protein
MEKELVMAQLQQVKVMGLLQQEQAMELLLDFILVMELELQL